MKYNIYIKNNNDTFNKIVVEKKQNNLNRYNIMAWIMRREVYTNSYGREIDMTYTVKKSLGITKGQDS